jgi:hypothetical protein
MHILNLSVEDMAGAAYTLSHAINKTQAGKHSAVAMTMVKNYINYPTMAYGKNYTADEIKKIIDAADTIVFHTAIIPYVSAFQLSKETLKDKKCLLYFHGTDCRQYGKAIISQAREHLPNFDVLVSTPDLLENIPEAAWMPVCRSFSEISERYQKKIKADLDAMDALNVTQSKVNLCHAPTNTARKGSDLFYKIITELVQSSPDIDYIPIQNMSWDSCLSEMSRAQIYYDQHLIGAYGTSAVEASIFKAAVFCKLSTNVQDILKSQVGASAPFIQWETEQEIREASSALVQDKGLRDKIGEACYKFSKAVHDEKPVAERFIKLVEGL